MIAGNTPNVDAVSGATYSSNGIIQAVQNALSQAAADGNSQQVTPTPAATAFPTPTSAPSPTKKPSKKPSPTKKPEDPDSPKKYLDGKYTASAKGFNGDVKVIVTIKDGVIEALKQENTDTEQFFERAWSVLEKQIIGTDSVDDIDTVSGATYSSNGILNAVKKALKETDTKANSHTETCGNAETNSHTEANRDTGSNPDAGAGRPGCDAGS